MKTILLAELEGCGREWIATELREEGYRVVTLDQGLALTEYLEFANLGIARMPWPDLIVSDVRLEGFRDVPARRMFFLVRATVPQERRVLQMPVNLGQLHQAIANCLI